jgi:hypothetical protein
MDLQSMHTSLGRFIESTSSELMPEAAAALLELLESDAVEPINHPGSPVSAEDVAERLENRLERLRRKRDDLDGLDLIEDAVAHLRAFDDNLLAPWTFEDGDGIRWFVLSHGDEVVACYTSAPFVETDV